MVKRTSAKRVGRAISRALLPTAAAPTRTEEATPRKRIDARMQAAGRIYREWREQVGLDSQKKGADALQAACSREKVSASLVAQIEAGIISSLAPEILRAIEIAYRRSPDEAFAVYAQHRFGVSDVKCGLLKEVILNISDLAAWERDLNVKALWIVTENILDDENPEIQDAIIELLRKGCEIHYFHSSREKFDNLCVILESVFEARKEELKKSFADVRGLLTQTEVGPAALAFMTSSIVIADPIALIANVNAKTTDAFLVFSAELTPGFGLRVSNRANLRKVIIRLNQILSGKGAPVVGDAHVRQKGPVND